jgi:uncharacterized protein HemY
VPDFPGFPGFPTPAGRLRRHGRAPGDDGRSGLPPGFRIGAGSVVGCLVRVIVTALALLALLAAGFFGLLGASGGARTWVMDFGQQVGVVDGVPEATTRAVAAYRAGDRARAERELGEAARTYRRSGVALLYLARLRLDAADDARAYEALVEAAAREPDSPLVRRTVAEYACEMAARDRAGGASYAADLLARAGGSAQCPADAGAAPAAPPP